jgi:hypothetical protein
MGRMLSTYAFALLFIIVLIISVAAATMMLLWLAQIEPFKRRKKRMYAPESEVAMLREEVESLKRLLGTFRTRSEAIENGLFKLQESIQKRKE